MNPRRKKSMDGVRPSSNKKTSEPRSLTRESLDENPYKNKKEPEPFFREIRQKDSKRLISKKKKGSQNYVLLLLKKSILSKKMYGYLVKIIFAVLIIFYVAQRFEKTSISIQPHIEYKDIELVLSAHRNPQDNELGFDIIAITDEVTFPIATKEKEGLPIIKGGFASGIINLKNNYSSETQELFSGTRFVSSSGQIFALSGQNVTIPGMEDNNPGTIEVTLTAIDSGEIYLDKNTVFNIPGYKELGLTEKFQKINGVLKKSFTLENQLIPTSGVSSVNNPELEKKLQVALSERLMERLALEKTDQFIIVRGSEKIIAQPTQYISNENNQSFVAKRGVIFAMLIGNNVVSQYILNQHMESQESQSLGIINPENLDIKTLDIDIDYKEAGQINIEIVGRPLFQSIINKDEVRQSLLGVTEDSLYSVISTNPRFDKAAVIIKPFWKKTATLNPERLEIIVRPQQ
jgi:hypothetical protein